MAPTDLTGLQRPERMDRCGTVRGVARNAVAMETFGPAGEEALTLHISPDPAASAVGRDATRAGL